MSRIDLIQVGGGYAYVSNPAPLPGSPVTLYAIPHTGESIIDIYGYDDQYHSIAFDAVQEQTFIYDRDWDYITIYVEFTGSPQPSHFPWWLLFKMRNKGKKYVK